MYVWRKMSDQEREEVLRDRKRRGHPWHSIPCIDSGPGSYLITAACFEHSPLIDLSRNRMHSFRDDLLQTCTDAPEIEQVAAWVILPNHYHFLCKTHDIRATKRALGKLHGRTSHAWNLEDAKQGRKVWFRSAETWIKSERHYWATVNYIHHNPVKHGYTQRQDEWPWSSFSEWLQEVGREDLVALWHRYPVGDYGKNWDEFERREFTKED